MKNNSVKSFFASLLKRHALGLTMLCILNFLGSGLSVLLALVSKNVIDVATKTAEGQLAKECIILAGVIILQISLTAATGILRSLLYSRIDITLKKRIFNGFINKKYEKTGEYHSGELLTRLTSDVDIITSGITDILPTVISVATKLIFGIVIIIYFSWIFALCVFIIGTVAAILSRLAGKHFKKMHKKCQESSGAVRSFMQESAENLLVVKTFSNSEPINKKLSGLLKKDYGNKVKRTLISTVTHIISQFVFSGGYYISLGWGAVQVALNAMTFGELTAFLQIVSQIRSPFMSMSGILTKYYSATASAERLIELEQLDEDPPVNKDLLNASFERIVIKDLSFAYGDKKVLKDCNCEIELGKTTTLVGRSGIGKSTLFRLLLGLYSQNSGKLCFVDGNGNETPIDASTRALFNYVPQGNFVLTGTIKENISFFNEDIPEEKITAAAKAAEIHDFIETLPDRYETVIGERGQGLSEGQIQRIALARALLFDAPILLLDESTSALDIETEKRIIENIKADGEKTVIFITHRTTALESSDKVLHFENMKIK